MTDNKETNYYHDMYEMLRHDYGDLMETYAKARIKANSLAREWQKSREVWEDMAIRDAGQVLELQKELDAINETYGRITSYKMSGIFDSFHGPADALDQMTQHIKDLGKQNQKLKAAIIQWRAWYPTVHMEIDEMPDTITECAEEQAQGMRQSVSPNWPQPGSEKAVEIILDEMDIPQYCGDCGRQLSVVRPGKWQCDWCDDIRYRKVKC